MGKEKRKFIPYNQLPTHTIEKIAEGLAGVSGTRLKDLVLQTFSGYFGTDALKQLPPCSIETASLLNVPNALVLVSFNTHPLKNSISRGIGGWAPCGLTRILSRPQVGDVPPIPVVYLMPNRKNDTLKHEKIHACQYLHGEAFPMTSDEKPLYHTMNLEDAMYHRLNTIGRDAAIDFIINATCYKTWIEMEAYYFTRKPERVWRWMMNVYGSSLPMYTFESISRSKPTVWKKGDMDRAVERFGGFCEMMEREVRWVRGLVRRSGGSSLHLLFTILSRKFTMSLKPR